MAPRTSGAPNGYTPRHLRTAQVYDEQITQGGSAIVDGGANIVAGAPVVSGSCNCAGAGCSNCTGDVYSEVISDGGCGCGDCQVGCGIMGCGLNGFFCGRCNTCAPLNTPCCDRGGCPPGTWEDCWLFGLGRIFYDAEYFTGASAFNGSAFNIAGANGTPFPDDNFGLYGGINLGIPLCRLSCGLLSGQIGALRSIQFQRKRIRTGSRDQTFFTLGLYRRVDYGLQLGVVADVLDENWFTDSTTTQIRGNVAWVYPNGAIYGFRFATNVEDDISDGVIGGTRVNGLITSTFNSYRFFYRRECECGGYMDLFGGFADESRGIVGLSCDMPVGERTAVQAGLTYLISEEVPNVGGTDTDSWNIYMGLSFRPRGLSWYQYYDRPMFDVADNGTHLIRRF